MHRAIEGELLAVSGGRNRSSMSRSMLERGRRGTVGCRDAPWMSWSTGSRPALLWRDGEYGESRKPKQSRRQL
jgi:hypothetical protein